MKYSNEEIKSIVAECWQKVFDLGEFDEDESIFTFGGNSLHIVQIVEFLKENYSIELEIEDIFNNDTANALTEFIINSKVN